MEMSTNGSWNLNATSDSHKHSENDQTIGTAVIVSSILSSLVLFVNLFSITTLLSQPKLRQNKYYRATLCLSISDLISALSVLHWCIQKFAYQNPATAKACLVGFIALSSAILQTHFQMVLVATERYLSSRGTVTSLRYCNVGVQVTYMALSWVFCVAYITTTALYHKKTHGIICGKGEFNWFKDSKSTLVAVIPIIPCLMIVIVFYILTNRNILKSSKRIMDAISASSRPILKA